jgi:hypothetical protein
MRTSSDDDQAIPGSSSNRVIDQWPVWHRHEIALLCAALLFCVWSFPAAQSFAAILTVTNNADSGLGTLRQAIAAAAAGDTIDFAVSGAITVNSTILIGKDLTLNGPGDTTLIIQRQDSIFAPDIRVFEVVSGTVAIAGLTISHGHVVSGGGGGILNSGKLTLRNVSVSQNFSYDGPGAGIRNQGQLVVNNCRVSENTGPQGGGIYNAGTLTVTNSVLKGNVTAGSIDSGAGIYNEQGATAMLSNSSFITNTTQIGGGVFNLGQLTVQNCSFSDNIAAASGGGINNAGNAMVQDSTFSGNFVSGGGGGGIRNAAILTVSNCVFTANVAFFGAGVGTGDHDRQADTKVIDSIITDGVAAKGGGFYSAGLLTVERCVVADNLALFLSGGIEVHYGGLVVRNSSIIGNTGDGIGGISIDLCPMTIESCTIAWNRSPNGLAGGIYCYTTSGDYTPVIRSSTISSNYASGDGGGIWATWLKLENCTIVGNQATNGGGVHAEVPVKARSCIIAGNSVSANGLGPDFQGTLASQDYNLVQNSHDCAFTGATSHNLIGVDPLLGSLQDNGGPTWTHALLPGSPAVDRGFAGGLFRDQRGQPRTQDDPGRDNLGGDATDIGAYESTVAPNIVTAHIAGTDWVMSFMTAVGRRYQIVASEDLDGRPWNVVNDSIVGNGGLLTISNPNVAIGKRRYLRAVLLP